MCCYVTDFFAQYLKQGHSLPRLLLLMTATDGINVSCLIVLSLYQ